MYGKFFYSSIQSIMKTRLKASFQCKKEDRDKFKNSIAQITISVGQPAHEDERFQATIELVNKHFKEAFLMIDDSLQWRTLAIRKMRDPDSFFQTKEEDWVEKAVKLGDDWLARNESAYKKLTIPYKIIRWSSWLNTQEFNQSIAFSNEEIKKNTAYQSAIHENMRAFLKRDEDNYGKIPEHMKHLAEHYCIEYLKEETGVMKCVWPSLKGNYEIYPSVRNQAMDETYRQWIKPYFPELLKPVSMRFSRKNIDNPTNASSLSENHSTIDFK